MKVSRLDVVPISVDLQIWRQIWARLLFDKANVMLEALVHASKQFSQHSHFVKTDGKEYVIGGKREEVQLTP